jgi:hypothetical protein
MESQECGAQSSGPIIYVGIACACALYLYANVFASPRLPYLFEGDQVFFWTYAQRMMQGQHAYTDFFQFTTPGVDFFYLALFRIFGARIWVTDLAIILIGCLLCCVCFNVASQLMRRRDALLGTSLFLVFIYGRILDGTHHWLSLFAVICAVRVLVPARTPKRIVASGILLGLASFFTQTTGVVALIGIGAALFAEHWHGRPWRKILRAQSLLAATFALTFATLCSYFAVHVGLRQLWYLWVIYASHNVSYTHDILLRSAIAHSGIKVSIQRFAVLIAAICVYLRVLWLSARTVVRREGPANIPAVALASVGIALLAAALLKPNWNRIYITSMPAIILFAWMLSKSGHVSRRIRMLLWISIAVFGMRRVVSAHRIHGVVDLPAGRCIPVDRRYVAEFVWLSHNTRPGDAIVQAAMLNTYLPLQLRDPLYVDGLWPSKKTPKPFVELSVEQVEMEQVKYIIWAPQMIGPVDEKTGGDDSLLPFREYMAAHYERIQQFPNGDEAWQRR